MYIERVSYKRTFNLGNFSSEVIGVEFVLNKDESEAVALQRAKEIVEDTHKKNYPNLVVPNEPIIEQVLSKEQMIENNLEAIAKCKTLDELRTLKLISKVYKETFEAFMEKTKELTKNM